VELVPRPAGGNTDRPAFGQAQRFWETGRTLSGAEETQIVGDFLDSRPDCLRQVNPRLKSRIPGVPSPRISPLRNSRLKGLPASFLCVLYISAKAGINRTFISHEFPSPHGIPSTVCSLPVKTQISPTSRVPERLFFTVASPFHSDDPGGLRGPPGPLFVTCPPKKTPPLSILAQTLV